MEHISMPKSDLVGIKYSLQTKGGTVMKSHIRRLAMVAASLFLMISFNATPSSALNLVNNGDFETGDLNGWTTNGTYISVGTAGFESAYAAILGTNYNLGYLSQSGIPTIIGQNYQLSYILASSGGIVNQFQASVNGNRLFESLNNGSHPYEVYTFDFIADSALTELVFAERNDPGGFLLDNVTLELAPIPEPSTLLLLGVGLLGASFLRKRIRRS